MSSIPPLTAQGSNIPRPRPASPCDSVPHPPPLPPPPTAPSSSHDSHGRSKGAYAATAATIATTTANTAANTAATAAATEPSLDNPDGHHARPPQSTASSSGDVGTDISQRPPVAPTLVKKDRARNARRDGISTVSKEAAKDPAHPRDSSKDVRDQRTNGRTTSPVHASSSVDPLSHHIFTRTNTERSIASRLLNPSRPETESPSNDSSLPRPGPDTPNKLSAVQPDSVKDKKKGVSFLSRLSMIGGKKRDEDILDDESELSEQRTEGANAVAFSAAVYIPHHKQPPRYIRIRAQSKKDKEFDRTFLAQELIGTHPSPAPGQLITPNGDHHPGHHTKADSSSGGPIWAVEFSQDGRFLATGGRDRVLRVWAVIATEEDRKAYDDEESAKTDEEERLSAPVFHSKPTREFKGHEGDILDLSWSKNNFLLSSSMDKTVRLWHMSRRECLCTFKHQDFVASIAFHPRDDRFFLAGSLDSSLRLWSIPDKAVAFSSQLTDIITAVGFSPDGKTAIAGTLHGFCMFYETEGLKYLSQLHVRSSRGKNAKGSKITGIQTMNFPSDNADGLVKLLVTSNDSRIRIYNMADKTLVAKLKGHENACNQIRASFSDDGAFVICGSEDRKAFIWSREMAEAESSREKCPGEYFEAHSDVVTTAIFAPTKTRQLLQASQDPIFTLCNPPPITLRSREESTANLTSSIYDAQSEYSAKGTKPEESPAFVSRSAHHDGNIIVTTDNSGLIKVFRQDCAFTKRRHDNWETHSSFSRKHARDRLLLARAGSIMTGTSVSSRDPQSRRGSLSQPLHISSDRINIWRHGVEGNPARPSSIALAATATTTPTGSVRSPSPNKLTPTPVSPNRVNPPSEGRRQLSSVVTPALYPTSPTASLRSNRTSEPPREMEATVPPTPNFSFRSIDDDADDSRLDFAGASQSFWSLNKWRNISHGRSGSGSLKPDEANSSRVGGRKNLGADMAADQAPPRGEKAGDRRSGHVSRLWPSPLEEERDEGEGDEFLAPPTRSLTNQTASTTLSRLSSELTASEEDGEEMECVKCGNHNFRAKKVGGMQRLLCGKCGRMVDV
ncbi:putative WD repeat domain-containing protein [Rosellinia necatrix]|uniref:Putative WD repeat domain-containing protein n=1 Tax=Rosellinia necatrix TaxID=77044 RepID=A0A1W2TKV2_ROSNE|nr:putative WD repeat domain-containing protein [Rosellinia necatrix]